eukprot:13216451-Ditylum_brightwellii.AAC.1
MYFGTVEESLFNMFGKQHAFMPVYMGRMSPSPGDCNSKHKWGQEEEATAASQARSAYDCRRELDQSWGALLEQQCGMTRSVESSLHDAMAFFSQAENAMTKGKLPPQRQCFGCSKHTYFQDNTDHLWRDCPHTNMPDVVKLAKEKRNEFFNQRWWYNQARIAGVQTSSILTDLNGSGTHSTTPRAFEMHDQHEHLGGKRQDNTTKRQCFSLL